MSLPLLASLPFTFSAKDTGFRRGRSRLDPLKILLILYVPKHTPRTIISQMPQWWPTKSQAGTLIKMNVAKSVAFDNFFFTPFVYFPVYYLFKDIVVDGVLNEGVALHNRRPFLDCINNPNCALRPCCFLCREKKGDSLWSAKALRG